MLIWCTHFTLESDGIKFATNILTYKKSEKAFLILGAGHAQLWTKVQNPYLDFV